MKNKNYYKKKIIILIIRKHAGEVDWILPILNEAKKKFTIITIFNNQKAFKSLFNNKDLYSLWRKQGDFYFVENKFDQFVYKLLFKLFSIINFSSVSNFFLEKIYNTELFAKKIKVNLRNIRFVFLSHNNYSFWPNILRKNFSTKIVRFPEAQHIWSYKSKYNQSTNTHYEKLSSDIILLSRQGEFFSKKFLSQKKVIYCGIPKYYTKWVNNFKLKKINNSKKIKIITIAIRPPFKGKQSKKYFSLESYNYLISSIIKLAKKFKNIKLVFKLHPNMEDKDLIKQNCIRKKFRNFTFSSEHLIKLGQKSDICISMYSSAVLDFLASKKPVIEFWRHDVDNIDLIKNKKNNKWVTIYSKLNLVYSASSYEELEKKIKHLIKKPKLDHVQFNNFLKITKSKLNPREILKKIYYSK